MEKENKNYSIIEQIIKRHKKYPGLEAILDDIVEDVYSHSEVILNTVTNENVINAYLEKVVATSIITVPKKLGYKGNVTTHVRTLDIKTSEQSKVDKSLVDKMINNAESGASYNSTLSMQNSQTLEEKEANKDNELSLENTETKNDLSLVNDSQEAYIEELDLATIEDSQEENILGESDIADIREPLVEEPEDVIASSDFDVSDETTDETQDLDLEQIEDNNIGELSLDSDLAIQNENELDVEESDPAEFESRDKDDSSVASELYIQNIEESEIQEIEIDKNAELDNISENSKLGLIENTDSEIQEIDLEADNDSEQRFENTETEIVETSQKTNEENSFEDSLSNNNIESIQQNNDIIELDNLEQNEEISDLSNEEGCDLKTNSVEDNTIDLGMFDTDSGTENSVSEEVENENTQEKSNTIDDTDDNIVDLSTFSVDENENEVQALEFDDMIQAEDTNNSLEEISSDEDNSLAEEDESLIENEENSIDFDIDSEDEISEEVDITENLQDNDPDEIFTVDDNSIEEEQTIEDQAEPSDGLFEEDNDNTISVGEADIETLGDSTQEEDLLTPVDDFSLEEDNEVLLEDTVTDLMEEDTLLETTDDTDTDFLQGDDSDSTTLNLEDNSDDIFAIEENDENNDASQANDDEFVPINYSKFSFEPEQGSSNTDIDTDLISKDIEELASKNPNLNVAKIYNLKYKENQTIQKIASDLQITEEQVIEVLNEIIAVI